MAISSTILRTNKPYLILSKTDSTQNIVPANGLRMGTVQAIWYGCVSFVVGDVVMFVLNRALSFTLSGDEYFMATEENVFFTETQSII